MASAHTEAQRARRAALRLAPRTCDKCATQHVTKDGHQACIRHKLPSRGGAACKNAPMPGRTLCRSHGGNAPHNKRGAAKRQLEAVARKLIPDLDDRTPITNPLERLLELAGEADAFRESLRLLANKLDNQIRYFGSAGGEQLRGEVAMYRVAIKDVTDLLIAIAKLDIDNQLVRLETRRVEMTVTALKAGAVDAGLTEEQQRSVMAHVGRHLRLIAG